MQDYIGAEKEWVYKDGRTWAPIPYSPCLFWVFPSRGYPPKAKDFALCSMQKIKAPQQAVMEIPEPMRRAAACGVCTDI